jgi:hypothetical protein
LDKGSGYAGSVVSAASWTDSYFLSPFLVLFLCLAADSRCFCCLITTEGWLRSPFLFCFSFCALSPLSARFSFSFHVCLLGHPLSSLFFVLSYYAHIVSAYLCPTFHLCHLAPPHAVPWFTYLSLHSSCLCSCSRPRLRWSLLQPPHLSKQIF